MLLLDRMQTLCPEAKVERNVALDKYTTLRVGGRADYFAEPADEKQLLSLLSAAKETETPVLLMGNGSNLLVRDGGFRGLALHMGRNFARMERTEEGIIAQSGALLSALSRMAQDEELTGLEFAQGIPGSVGGGVYMNAGAYGGEMGQVVSSVRVLEGQRILEVPGQEMGFSYRHTRAMDQDWVILAASFRMRPGDPEAIDRLMKDFAARRREKQPLEYPSAGSFFKRPQGYFAGALIEQAGLKGLTVGGAQVSEKHAGFLINRGGAKASDFLNLMRKVQDAVEAMSGVRLEPEVRIVGSEA